MVTDWSNHLASWKSWYSNQSFFFHLVEFNNITYYQGTEWGAIGLSYQEPFRLEISQYVDMKLIDKFSLNVYV